MADLTLAIRLTGDGSSLKAEVLGGADALDDLSKAGGNAGRSAKRLADDTNSLAVKMGAVAGVVGKVTERLLDFAGDALIGGIKRTIDFGDQVQKLSIRIGASAEALSEFNYVAQLNGVRFDALATAWQRQTRRISEATKGTGEAVAALQELGFSADALSRMAPEDQFLVLADALAGVADQGDRVRLAMKFWDTEGVQLLQIAEGGAAQIQALRQEAEALGLSLSREQADQMAAVNDALTRLNASGNTLANTLAVQLGPTLEGVVNFINLNLPVAIDYAGKAFDTLRHVLLEGVQFIAAGLESLYSVLGNLPGDVGQTYRDAAADIAEFSATLEELQLSYALQVGSVERFTVSQREGFASLAEGARGTTASVSALNGELKALEKLATRTQDILGALSPNAELAGYFEALATLEEAQRAGIITTDELAAAAERLAEEYELLNDGVDEMAPSMMALAEAGEKTAKELKKNDDLARDLGLTFSSAFEDALVKGESLRDVIQGLGQDIARIVIRRNITEPLSDAVGGLFGGGESGGGGGFLGGLTDLIFGQQFHAGGEVGRDGTPRLVDPRVFAGAPRMHRGGLAGDEVPAILQRGERVLPRGESGGAVVVHYAPVINAIDTQSGLQFLAGHRDLIVGLVNDAYNRRGARGPVR